MTAFVLIAYALLMQIAASLCELLFSRAAGWHWCMPCGIYNPRDTWYFMIKETDLVWWCWGIHSTGQPDGRIHLVYVWGMNTGCGEAGTAPTASWHCFPSLITGANFLCWLEDLWWICFHFIFICIALFPIDTNHEFRSLMNNPGVMGVARKNSLTWERNQPVEPILFWVTLDIGIRKHLTGIEE